VDEKVVTMKITREFLNEEGNDEDLGGYIMDSLHKILKVRRRNEGIEILARIYEEGN
jgi:hypothetical protein